MPQTDRTGGGDLILSSRYTRVTSSQDIVPVPTDCQRIATNQRGSLQFLTINEIPAVKDNDVWEGADSGATGIHQKYAYEPETEIPTPLVEGSDSVQSPTGSGQFGASYGTLLGDLILGFTMAFPDDINVVMRWDTFGNNIVGAVEEEVIDAGQDKAQMLSIVTPGPATGAPSTGIIYLPDAVSQGFIGQSIHIRNGLLGLTASSEEAGSSPSLSITPLEPSSIVIGCASYQGTLDDPPLIPNFTNTTGWTVLQNETMSTISFNGLVSVQATYWRQVPNKQLVTLNPTVNNHDGVNTTSMFLAAIQGTGDLNSVWQQFILMKDGVGDFDPSEGLALQ